jgi:C4-dicarboxylate-binding protein DctP
VLNDLDRGDRILKKVSHGFLILLILFVTACSGNSTTSTGESSVGNSNSESENTSSNNSNKKYVLRVSHAYPESSTQHASLEWINEELRKRSEGRLSLDIFPGGQLMPPDQEIPGILNGQIDMGLLLSSSLGNLDPVWYLFDLPYLFDFDPEDPSVYLQHKRAFITSENGGGLVNSLTEKNGLKVLSMSQDNYSELLTSRTDNAITNLASFKGKKIRTTGGSIQNDTLTALGASPMVVAAPEVTPALQQGVIDGVLTTAYYGIQHYPVKTWTGINLSSYVLTVTMSTDKFNSLPKDLQDILLETAKDFDKWIDEQSLKMMTVDINKMVKEKGIEVYFPTTEEHGEFKRLLEPLHQKWADSIDFGNDLLEEVKNTQN